MINFIALIFITRKQTKFKCNIVNLKMHAILFSIHLPVNNCFYRDLEEIAITATKHHLQKLAVYFSWFLFIKSIPIPKQISLSHGMIYQFMVDCNM